MSNPEMIAAIVAEAVKAALAAGAAQTPVPGSLAQTYAAGPPSLPPPQPSVVAYEQPDTLRTLKNVMGWLPTPGWKQPVIWWAVRDIWVQDPSRFKVLGGYHTTPEGDRTYLSVSVLHPKSPYSNLVLHLYGSIRHCVFKVCSIDVIQGTNHYKDVVVSSPRSAQSSVDGWEGYE